MSRMLIRDALPGDWPPVAALLAELGRPDVRESPDEDAHRRVFEAYLDRSDTVALVAEDDGRVVGFCDLEFRQRLNFLAPQAWIPDLVVAESARGRGAGRALLAAARERAVERGCWGMTLESATWRTGAHAFYERLGWTDSGKSFTHRLADIDWPPAPR